MQQALKFGVSAVTSDGRDVGTLYRVVIDERAEPGGGSVYVVTAITVQRRLIESGNLLKPGGWDRPRDLLIPFAHVTGSDDEEVRLTLTEEEFLAQAPYILGDRPEPDGDWEPPAEFRAEDVTMRAGALLGGGLYEPPHDEQENRAPSERHLSRGAEVWRRDPHELAGNLDRVLMDDTSNVVIGLVVSQGILFHHDAVVQAGDIVDLLDDLVHIDLPAGAHALQPYRPSD